MQRRALLHHLGLSTSHYLKLQPPQGPGQAPQVALEPLLNTAAICLMPDHLAYHWWQAPAAAKQPQLAAASTQEAAKPQGEHVSPPSLINSSSQVVPGQVEVKAAPRLAHSQRPAVTATTGLVRPPPAGLPEASAPTSSSSEPSAQREPLGTAAGVSSASLEGDAQTANSDGSPFGCSPVHVQLQVLGSLQRLLTAKLDAIAGGSAEEDRALSQQPGCSQAAMMALEYRADQKEIAAAALTSLMRKTSEVVLSASARLPGGTGQTVQPGQPLVAAQVMPFSQTSGIGHTLQLCWCFSSMDSVLHSRSHSQYTSQCYQMIIFFSFLFFPDDMLLTAWIAQCQSLCAFISRLNLQIGTPINVVYARHAGLVGGKWRAVQQATREPTPQSCLDSIIQSIFIPTC